MVPCKDKVGPSDEGELWGNFFTDYLSLYNCSTSLYFANILTGDLCFGIATPLFFAQVEVSPTLLISLSPKYSTWYTVSSPDVFCLSWFSWTVFPLKPTDTLGGDWFRRNFQCLTCLCDLEKLLSRQVSIFIRNIPMSWFDLIRK